MKNLIKRLGNQRTAASVSPRHAVVFGARKDFLSLNCAYQTAPKTIERP